MTGGTFRRSYDGVRCTDPSYPATVSDFQLDTYEVTVGRFRAFVRNGRGTRRNPPSPGDGAHPRIAGSGWDPAWNDRLAPDDATLSRQLRCHERFATWTDTPVGDHERLPINCLTWYEAFAFCAWDGGRLPTEAERNYAASGGDEQRVFPWSSPPRDESIGPERAVYGALAAEAVGSRSPLGDGRYGQADLAGNVWEWTLDSVDGRRLLPTEGARFCDPSSYPTPCRDCARLDPDAARVLRGGGFGIPAPALIAALRRGSAPTDRFHVFGARCARAPSSTHAIAPPPCVARCEGHACGPDGCGGACGVCPDGGACGPEGACAAPWPAGPYGFSVGDTLPELTLTGYPDARRDALRPVPFAGLYNPGADPARPTALALRLTASWATDAATLDARVAPGRGLILLVEGHRRGQTADGADLDTWAREHPSRVPLAMDRSDRRSGPRLTLPATMIVDLRTMRVTAATEDVPPRGAPFWTALEADDRGAQPDGGRR